MPVTGLPIAVETSLNALLSGHAVSSWKIVGEGDSTVVVFRLKPIPDSTTTTNMASAMPSAHSYYRRKPPSQLKRDHDRAVLRQQQHPATDNQASDTQNCVGDTPLFLPSPDFVDISTCENRPMSETPTAPTEDGTGFSHDNGKFAQTGSKPDTDNYSELACGGTVDYTTNGISSPSADPLQLTPSCINNARAAGITVNVVKDYVATLSNRSVQIRLRDTRRNVYFRKTVQCNRNNRDFFLFESDDLILEYDAGNGSLVFWYVKQDSKSMSSEEHEKLNQLRRGRHIGDSTTPPPLLRARAEHHLDILADLMRFYLG